MPNKLSHEEIDRLIDTQLRELEELEAQRMAQEVREKERRRQEEECRRRFWGRLWRKVKRP